MKITIAEYAKRVGKLPTYICDRCRAGKFPSAEKIDGAWMIDEAEPYPPIDNRVKSGKYKDWRKKYGRHAHEQNPNG